MARTTEGSACDHSDDDVPRSHATAASYRVFR
jgi:hypothetical protein